MNVIGKTIKLFLVDGIADGILTAEIANWTGKVIVAPRTKLAELASRPEVVAIGECGLDYNRDFSPRRVQDRWFEAQVQLACDLKMRSW